MAHWQEIKQKLFNVTIRLLRSILQLTQWLVLLFIQLINQLIKLLVWLLFSLVFPFAKIVAKKINQMRRYLSRNSKAFLGVIILFICTFLIFTSLFWHGSNTFEGNITVQEMSFTYAGNQEKKLFINAIRDIKKLDFSGKQNLTIKGHFMSKSDAKLNQLNQITIQLPYTKSKLTLTPVEPNKPSKIELNDLQLQPNTEVNQLRYNSYGNILSLCLEKSNKSEDLCLQNNISTNQPSQSKAEKLGQLNLELGGQPLKVNIEGYNIAQLGKKDSPNNPNPLEFVFTPEASQLELNLTPPTNLYISLPKLTSVDSSQWLRGNLEVENVKFSHPDQTGNVGDEFDISTILQGKIRMAEQELEIKPNQFLITDKPGIQLLRYLQIQSKPPQGLLVRFSGNSESIETGLDPKFIVDSIRPSFLAKYLSKDAITVLLSFCAAVAGALLPLLFAKSSESNSKP